MATTKRTATRRSSGRTAAVARTTKETSIRLRLGVDGTGRAEVATGVPFLDHMLELFARHGLFDLSGRPFFAYEVRLKQAKIGDFDVELIHDFLLALVNQAGMNLHVRMLAGRNPHHVIEADRATLVRLGPAVARLARVEGLEAHARAVEVRLGRKGGER